MVGGGVVTGALISYSIGVNTEQRTAMVSNKVLWFLTFGVFLDISATIMMIIGSRNSPFTFHGFVGYSALVLMLIDASLIWKYRILNGMEKKVTRILHLYTRYAYIWWIAAYITGSSLIIYK